MVDALFADPRLAAIYDAADGDRDDLELYLSLAAEVGASSILDLGCGTGTLACLLAARGLRVAGVDPAAAMLDVARHKPGAEAVEWFVGDVKAVGGERFDLVTMTGNVAQVFLTDTEWLATLRGIREALRPRGMLAFEVREPANRAWQEWTPEQSRQTFVVDDVGPVESWVEVTEIAPPLVSFRWSFNFLENGTAITSDSTLRFQSREEVCVNLEASGFAVRDVRDAPDRPGRELVFLAAAAA